VLRSHSDIVRIQKPEEKKAAEQNLQQNLRDDSLALKMDSKRSRTRGADGLNR